MGGTAVTLLEGFAIAAAGFGAGVVNGAAGGGSLVSFPALLAIGHPAIVANVTSTVGIWPGYVGGVAGYRSAVAAQRDRVVRLLPAAVLGSAVGVVVLLSTPEDAFRAAAPWLILGASSLFAVQPLVARWVGDSDHRLLGPASPLLPFGVFLASIYGSYFGAGLGVILLALLGLFLGETMDRLNGLRGVIAMAVNCLALVLFALTAPVAWGAAGLMAITSLPGGFTGARIAQWLGPTWFRVVVVVFGVMAAGRLLMG